MVLLHAAAARANGAFPDSQSILTPEARPHEIRLATNFGIIASDDDGQSWVWSCEQAESNNGSLYQMGPAPKNRLYVISSEGLAFSDNDSCGWSIAGGTVRARPSPTPSPIPRTPAACWRSSSARARPASATAWSNRPTAGRRSAPRATPPRRATTSPASRSPRSAPSTIYVAMTSGPTFAPKLARSTDGGATWKVEDLSTKLPAKTTLIRLVAVDPTNADRVYLRTHSAAGDAFAVAVAGASGFTVTTPLNFPDGILSAYARLASGTIVVAAVVGLDEVAYRSTDAGASFQPLPTPPSVRAMSARGATLYVVADNVADGYAVGTSVDEGQTWQPLMRYDQILAIQACVKQACQTDCLMRAAAGQWSEDFCAATAPASPDGGAPTDADAGDDAHRDAGPADGGGGSAGGSDASVPPPPKSGCSCGVAPAVRSGPPR